MDNFTGQIGNISVAVSGKRLFSYWDNRRHQRTREFDGARACVRLRVTSHQDAGTGNGHVLLQTATSAQNAETVPQETRRLTAGVTLRAPKPACRRLSGDEGERRQIIGQPRVRRWTRKQEFTSADHTQRLTHPSAAWHAYDTRRRLSATCFRRRALQSWESALFSVHHPVPFLGSSHRPGKNTRRATDEYL